MENADINTKRKQTNIERFGTGSPLGNADVMKKMVETNKLRYGEPYILCKKEVRDLGHKCLSDINVIDGIRNARRDTVFNRFVTDLSMSVLPMFSIDEFRKTGCTKDSNYKWRCKKCGTEFIQYYYSYEPRCPTCFPFDLSLMHSEVQEFLTNLDIKFTTNDRKVISPMELDILIQDQNIAIELDGLFWHSESNHTDKNYHLKKTELCKENGITLIHIFEDEWIHQRKIVKNCLRNLFEKNAYSINASRCEVMEITSETKNMFLEKYNIQGKDCSSIHLGSFYKGRLVAVMTFGDLKLGHYELIRFCTISNFTIIDIANKMLNHFEQNYNPLKIIGNADRRWDECDIYYKLGFDIDHVTDIDYWYFKARKRIHKSNFMKDNLEKFDESLSEYENMKNNGWDRIWDCGNIVFKKNY